jgi:hypothetical protein
MTHTQSLCLSAVQQGVSVERAIVIWTALDTARVQQELRELERDGLVHRDRSGWHAVITQRGRG